MYQSLRNLVLFSGVVSILVFCLQLPTWTDRILLGSLGVVGFSILVIILGERFRRLIDGYYTFIRGGAEDGDLVYVEGNNELRLYFKRRPHTIYVPSNKTWEDVMPNWARQNKEIIIARIKGQLGKHWSFEDTENQERILRQKE
jgi:hypothetical protein